MSEKKNKESPVLTDAEIIQNLITKYPELKYYYAQNPKLGLDEFISIQIQLGNVESDRKRYALLGKHIKHVEKEQDKIANQIQETLYRIVDITEGKITIPETDMVKLIREHPETI